MIPQKDFEVRVRLRQEPNDLRFENEVDLSSNSRSDST